MTNKISNAIDLTYLRGQVLALYKLMTHIQETINEVEDKIKKGEAEDEK